MTSHTEEVIQVLMREFILLLKSKRFFKKIKMSTGHLFNQCKAHIPIFKNLLEVALAIFLDTLSIEGLLRDTRAPSSETYTIM